MLGYLHSYLEAMVVIQHGFNTWQRILQKSSFPPDTKWELGKQYDDDETFSLFTAVGFTLGMTMDDLLETFGTWFFGHAMDNGWDKLMESVANDLHEFLDNLTFTHFFMYQLVFDRSFRVPKFKCDARPDGSLRLHYYTTRKGLSPFAKGMLKTASKLLFDVEIKVNIVEHNQERRMQGTSEVLFEHIVFSVEASNKGTSLCNTVATLQANKLLLAGDDHIHKPLTMSVGFFAAMFPTHVCFNKQMAVEHCGEFLYQELEMDKRRTVNKMGDIFTMAQPDDIPMNFKTIVTHLNSVFILRLKMPIKRNQMSNSAAHGGGSVAKMALLRVQHGDSGSAPNLAFKGQMILVNGGNSLLYMNSPYVSTVRGLMDAHLFMSDLQRHDATRDVIMLNQSRISQQELNKRLEETVKRMEYMGVELERSRDRNSQLTVEFLPTSVAESIKSEETVAAKEFAEATCLQCEIPDFVLINRRSDPREMVNLITDLSYRFDKLINRLDCYKVLSLMDTYFAIAGVPAFQANHAELILNLALGMAMEAKSVRVPKINLPIMLRIGIHSGPVVAGVVGTKRVRYCVIGETVNVAKRLTHYVEIGKILVTTATKTIASKSSDANDFDFTNRGYMKIGPHQATCTYYLERNAKRNIWDIVGREKPEDSKSEDGGYDELHCEADIHAWEVVEREIEKQRRVVEAMQRARRHGMTSDGAHTTRNRIVQIPRDVMDARLRSIRTLWYASGAGSRLARMGKQVSNDSGLGHGSSTAAADNFIPSASASPHNDAQWSSACNLQ